MKVLKEGIWNNVWTTKVTCPTCKSELLVEEPDVKATDYTKCDYHCACLVCSERIALLGESICLRVRKAVDKQRVRPSYDCRD